MAELGTGGANGAHFGVGGGIEQGERRIAALARYFAIHHDDTTHRHFASFFGLARKVEGLGYSTLFIPDHFGDQWAPMVALTAAAEATTAPIEPTATPTNTPMPRRPKPTPAGVGPSIFNPY